MSKDIVWDASKCRLCGEDTKKVAKLADTPVGDRFFKDKNIAISWELHNVELVLCGACGQIQLSEVVEPKQVYDDEYLYTTAVSIGLPEHFRQSAHSISERFGSKGAFVVEIGSNEGVMLEAFKELEAEVLGVDPARIASDIANAKGIETIHDFFTDELARKIASTKKKADVILANNVIANIPNLVDVTKGIEVLLSDNGVFIFETSYALDVVEKHLIDTIYHEHISYFTVQAMDIFFEKHNLVLFDTERINTKGGSLRGYVAKTGSKHKKTDNVKNMIEEEQDSGIFNPARYPKFEENLKKFGEQIKELADSIKSSGNDVVVYGASVGCVMMMYHFGLDKFVDYLVDDNQSKIDKFCPTLGVKVYSSDILKDKQNLVVISLAWRFMDSILKKHSTFKANNGVFKVIDLSRLEILDM